MMALEPRIGCRREPGRPLAGREFHPVTGEETCTSLQRIVCPAEGQLFTARSTADSGGHCSRRYSINWNGILNCNFAGRFVDFDGKPLEARRIVVAPDCTCWKCWRNWRCGDFTDSTQPERIGDMVADRNVLIRSR